MGARLFYIGLWTCADDAGVFEWHERLLKSQIFPFDEGVKVDKFLNELIKHNRIKSFSHNGKEYGLILNFTKYQKPDSRYIKYTIGDYDYVKSISHNVVTSSARGVPTTEGVSEGVIVSEGVSEGGASDGSPSLTTPFQEAKSFFENEKKQEEIILFFLEKGANENAVRKEMKNFVLYWTEPNKIGTKQKWQLQQTFDVKRRLSTWFSRVKDFSSKTRGYGKTAIIS